MTLLTDRIDADARRDETCGREELLGLVAHVLKTTTALTLLGRSGVRVASPLAALGRQFDHVWVLGLSDTLFPARAAEHLLIDSVAWPGEQLTAQLPDERIALYSGPTTSGIYHAGTLTPTSRDELKRLVQSGEIRLLLGTDAASEGLNLQRLSRLINLDLPWNPTRLEQRKGRIQRIGQRHSAVHLFNLRYRDSVEDRVHARLSERLSDIRTLFGQIPDVLEDVWIQEALGEARRAQQVIDAVPTRHAFEIRNAEVKLSHWEGCTEVLSALDVQAVLKKSWFDREKAP